MSSSSKRPHLQSPVEKSYLHRQAILRASQATKQTFEFWRCNAWSSLPRFPGVVCRVPGCPALGDLSALQLGCLTCPRRAQANRAHSICSDPGQASSSTHRMKGWTCRWFHLPQPSLSSARGSWIIAAPAPTACLAENQLLMPVSAPAPAWWNDETLNSISLTRLLSPERIRSLHWHSCQVCGRGRARLCSHAPKAVRKPENTAQSDVNKQVLHILLSQIFRSLKRIGCVIESSRRQLCAVLPALTQPITPSFTWQLDRVTRFHMAAQFSDEALQPKQRWKTHLHGLWFQQAGRDIFLSLLQPCPRVTHLRKQPSSTRNLCALSSWISIAFSQEIVSLCSAPCPHRAPGVKGSCCQEKIWTRCVLDFGRPLIRKFDACKGCNCSGKSEVFGAANPSAPEEGAAGSSAGCRTPRWLPCTPWPADFSLTGQRGKSLQ